MFFFLTAKVIINCDPTNEEAERVRKSCLLYNKVYFFEICRIY